MDGMTTTKNAEKFIYPFGQGVELPELDKNLLGGKGKNLVEMTSLGLPVPPGFIITTDTCREYLKLRRKFPEGLEEEVNSSMKVLEKQMEAEFGSKDNPLLVSVRSGAPVSMPGMMDTVLNLGLNDESVEGFARVTDNEKLAYDSYRRFIMFYADVVKGVDKRYFESAFQNILDEQGVEEEVDLDVEGFKEACSVYKKIYQEHLEESFPQDPWQQLYTAITAVFDSWDGDRAKSYRQYHKLPDDMGTAVNVQSMVFGNRGSKSATGVGFTRDPATGDNHFYGEFLVNAQGEEVVAGVRTPHPINKYQKRVNKSELRSLEEIMPEVYQQLHDIVDKLEEHYKDMQDIEFTIDDGRLFMLQTRTGKRTGFAAIRMATEMYKEGLIDEKTALLRIDPEQAVQLLAPIFDPKQKKEVQDSYVAKGLNAGPGAASGKAVLSWETAVEYAERGEKCVLVREETCPDDFPGMVAAEGILTARGGSTSHAAVVARGMGKPCVAGCGDLNIDESAKTISAKGKTIKEGDNIAIDGMTGEVFFCELHPHPSEVVQVLVDKTKKLEDSLICREFLTIMEISEKYRQIGVRANADTPRDAQVSLAFGAEGIGLCRTEHMFMDADRLTNVRKMFFSKDDEERNAAIDLLLKPQKEDFLGIFREMDGKAVTIRLLDPPLHEFMPHNDEELRALSENMKVDLSELREIKRSLKEGNPMLGHRGCRLGIAYPELTCMQARAILEAAIEVSQEGKEVLPEIMVPLVSIEKEFQHQKELIDQTAAKVFEEKGCKVDYMVGTMIELPRAALRAGYIAEEAQFFSFGTNDLTQTTFGISRDDSGRFVPLYVEGVKDPSNPREMTRILKSDPFQVLDTDGVGELMEIAVERGRSTRPDLKCGICGEHGGEPHSVEFCHKIGLNYVSCSPYRVPVARLAAAQAACGEVTSSD
ncbi:MAG: pyruvate, phosphate dikinase [Chlamydiota bacterium]